MAKVNQLLERMAAILGCPKYTINQFPGYINKQALEIQASHLPDTEIDVFLGDDDTGEKIPALVERYGLSQLHQFLDDVFNGHLTPKEVLNNES